MLAFLTSLAAGNGQVIHFYWMRQKKKKLSQACARVHTCLHIYTHSTYANNTTDLIPLTEIDSTSNKDLNWNYATKKHPDNRRNLADFGQGS